jgi:hypothetical protein
MASYGADQQHESTSFSLALLLATERLEVIAAVHPGLWRPGVLAKLGATADHLSDGRFLRFQEEVEHFGRWVLPLVRELENAKRPLRRASA